MILMLGLAADATFMHTVRAVRSSGLTLSVFDLAELIVDGTVVVEPGGGRITVGPVAVNLAAVHGAYVRLVGVATGAPTPSLAQRSRAVEAVLQNVFDTATFQVVNPPTRECSNFAKFLHGTALARLAGWRHPRSCVTQEPDEVRAFVAGLPEGAIYKGASARKTWVNAYDAETDDPRLERLAACPVLFQERVVGPDVRVHVVGAECFAEAIQSDHVDYRARRGNRYDPIDLPPGVAAGCAALTRQLHVPFLGVDFKIRERTGEWFFLEANSMPCYEGYDRRSDGAISRALCRILAEG